MRENEATLPASSSFRSGDPSGDRHRIEIGKRSHPILRHARIEEILDAGIEIEPVGWLNLAAAAQVQQDRTGNVSLRYAKR